MFSRLPRMMFSATAASLLLSGPLAAAQDPVDRYADQPSCAELENSALRAPEWYAERCGGAVPDALAPQSDNEFVPGDTVYLCTLFSPAGTGFQSRLLTAPLPTSNFTNVGVCSPPPLSLLAMDFDNPASVLWAIDSQCSPTTGICSGTAYGTVNQATGVFTPVGNITGAPAGTNFAGLRFDPTNSTVYVMTITGAVSMSQLHSLNLTTGVATPIGAATAGVIIDIAISNTGVMYGHEIGADTIVTIDKTTGVVTPVGQTGIDANFAQGMDFDPSDNTLYLFAFTQPDGVGRIGRVNLTTGAFTQLSQNTEEFESAIDVPACTPPAAPTGTTATATASNQITVTWNPVGGATGYNVYRAAGSCPQTNYTLRAPNVSGTTFVDNGLSGGSTFAYVVKAITANCESAESNCSSATATGPCFLPPTFAGLASATSAGTPACAINLAWSAATPTCAGTTVKYNVYRSTTPGAPPSGATLIQSCLTTLNYADGAVVSGTPYYYVVRAEDDQTGGTGACNTGFQDANLVERSAVPGGASATSTDNVESGGAFWNTAGGSGTNLWAIVTTQANSPTRSWFVANPATVSDRRLATVSAGTIPAAFTLSFFQRYQTEESSTPGLAWDGHVLEYSLDGTTWVDILAGTGPIPANPNRFTMNGYNRVLNPTLNPLSGRQCWSGDQLAFQEVRVNMADFAGRNVYLRFRFGSDQVFGDQGVWIDDITYRFPTTCSTLPAQGAAPFALAVDAAPGNGVFQPNETVTMAPTWRNAGTTSIALTGALTNHTGPAGATYAIPDDVASYGTIAVGATASCSDCYTVSNAATTRPLTHWDSTVLETVNPTATTKTWMLHIGDSFTDVAPTNGFYRFIETILHKNVTGGCTTTEYCPIASTTREAMAVFVLVSSAPGAPPPPLCVAGSETFTDVPASSGFCRWIEELERRGVVTGCGATTYCPTASATREQMAVFVLRTLDGTLNPPACMAGSEAFDDVPASSGFCRWIEELFRRGVVTGCGGGNYCPGADVTREQMSVFLAVTFGLMLYGL